MVAEKMLAQWPEITAQFVKVMPTDYKRVLAERAKHDEEIEAGVHGSRRAWVTESRTAAQ